MEQYPLNSFIATGKLGNAWGFGQILFGDSQFGYSLPLGGIYHRYRSKKGIFVRKMRYYVPSNPRTTLQQSNRQKFSDAVSAWHALTSEERALYNENAKGKGMFGFNLFISEYMKS